LSYRRSSSALLNDWSRIADLPERS